MRQKICTESMYSWLPGRLSNGTHKRMSWVSTALLNLISVVPLALNSNWATYSHWFGLDLAFTRM